MRKITISNAIIFSVFACLLFSNSMLAPAQAQQLQTQDGPKYGGTLIMGITQGWEPSTLNPNITWGAGPADKIFNGLIEFDLDLNQVRLIR